MPHEASEVEETLFGRSRAFVSRAGEEGDRRKADRRKKTTVKGQAETVADDERTASQVPIMIVIQDKLFGKTKPRR